MAQGMGGGQDSADPDGGPGAGFGGDEGNLGDAQDGQNAPSGSPTGGHPDNDSSTGPSYGGNQTAADLNFDSSSADADAVRDAMRGWDTQALAFGAGSPTGTHPDQKSLQAAMDQENAVTSLYGAYDDSGYQQMKEVMHQAQNRTKNMAITGIDVETFDFAGSHNIPGYDSRTLGMGLNPATPAPASLSYDSLDESDEGLPNTGINVESFGAMQNQNSIDVESFASMPTQESTALTAPPSISLATPPPSTALNAPPSLSYGTIAAPPATSIDTESYDQARVGSKTAAQIETMATEEHDVDKDYWGDLTDAEKQSRRDARQKAFDDSRTATPAQIEEARQRHRAIEARQWGKTALDAKTAWGVLDAQLKETETKTYFGLNFEVPKMSKFAKEKALIAFRDKYGKQIEAYNKHYNYQAKQSKQEPGLINPVAMLAGLINPILGFAVRVGQKYGYNESPMETAIREAEIDAGIREADHGEDITKEACEAMGYKWNEGLQACIKSDGAIHQGNWGAGENAVSSG